MSIDLLCVGETMAMITPVDPQSLRTATNFRMHAGGAESNVAMYAARAGMTAAWLSRLGADPMGSRLLDAISASGVLVEHVERVATHPTGLYLKSVEDGCTQVFYYRRGSAASTLDPEVLSRVNLSDIGVVLSSGITVALSESCHRLVDAIAHSPARFAFDVNYRPTLWPAATAAAVLRPIAQRADIVFVGLDEANTLWHSTTPDDVRDLFPDVARVIVKDADVGATEYNDDGCVFAPSPAVEVVEAVGAGDAFAAGYLTADFDGLNALGRLQRGHQFAARALTTTADVADHEEYR